MEIKVVKRDGSEETFQPQKIEKVVKAAGLIEEEAKALAAKITSWVKNLGKPKVTSLEIRDQVISELKVANEYAFNMFTWYQKTKDGQS